MALLELNPDYFKNQKHCIHCGCCCDICSTHALTMVREKDGSMQPEWDVAKCIYCNRCIDACKIFHDYYPHGKGAEAEETKTAAIDLRAEAAV